MTRIQVYTDPEMKRRIELAAARWDISVTQYCLEVIRQRLEDDAILEEETIVSGSATTLSETRSGKSPSFHGLPYTYATI